MTLQAVLGTASGSRQDVAAAIAKQALAAKPSPATTKILSTENPRLKAAETQKTWARQKIEELGKLLKILKKLYAQDPKKMAKALAQVFKELTAAVKAYKSAVGQELSLSDELTGDAEAVSAPATPPASDAQAADTPDPGASPATPATEGSAAYASAEADFRKSIAEDGLSFLSDVREFGRNVTDLLNAARVQAKAAKPDKKADDAFEDADKALKTFDKEMSSMEQDIRMTVPTAGMRLSVAA